MQNLLRQISCDLVQRQHTSRGQNPDIQYWPGQRAPHSVLVIVTLKSLCGKILRESIRLRADNYVTLTLTASVTWKL